MAEAVFVYEGQRKHIAFATWLLYTFELNLVKAPNQTCTTSRRFRMNLSEICVRYTYQS